METPRLRVLNARAGRVHTDLDVLGYSEKGFGWFEVPPPGGRYLVSVAGPVEDDEAHVVLLTR